MAALKPSENGWFPAKATKEQCQWVKVPGAEHVSLEILKGVPLIVMPAFAADFHAYIEPLRDADSAARTETNKVPTSNHLNATGMDLNWNGKDGKTFRYGISKERAYPGEESRNLDELLDFYEGIIYCGGGWDIQDWMHFQMGYDTYNNPRVQDFIRRKIRPDGFSTFRRGGETSSPARKLVVPGADGTTWVDVSEYQGSAIDGDKYPYEVFSFRTNSGDREDKFGVENAKRAKQLLDSGKLQLVVPYYFFRPGQANCDLHREILERAGLFNHPRTVTMVDIEGDNGSVVGDNSWEINDEISRIGKWYGDSRRVIGYYNSNADAGLWNTRNNINLVVPQYYRTPGDISSIKDAKVRAEAIAHQYTDRGNVGQWEPVDLNWSPYTVRELLGLFGIEEQKGLFMYLTKEEELAIRDKILGYDSLGRKWPSRALFADSPGGVDDTVGMLLNSDGNIWDVLVIIGALAGVTEHRNRIQRLANGEGPNGKNPNAVQIAQELLRFIQGSDDNA